MCDRSSVMHCACSIGAFPEPSSSLAISDTSNVKVETSSPGTLLSANPPNRLDNKRGVFCLVVGKEPDVACSCQHLVSWNKILSTAKDFSGLERSFAEVASIRSTLLPTK